MSTRAIAFSAAATTALSAAPVAGCISNFRALAAETTEPATVVAAIGSAAQIFRSGWQTTRLIEEYFTRLAFGTILAIVATTAEAKEHWLKYSDSHTFTGVAFAGSLAAGVEERDATVATIAAITAIAALARDSW